MELLHIALVSLAASLVGGGLTAGAAYGILKTKIGHLEKGQDDLWTEVKLRVDEKVCGVKHREVDCRVGRIEEKQERLEGKA